MSDELRLALDHVSLSVADLGQAKKFYTAILAPLGLELVGEMERSQDKWPRLSGSGTRPSKNPEPGFDAIKSRSAPTAEQSGSVAFAGFGIGRKGQLWLAEQGQQSPQAHICFRARTRAEVRAFFKAGLASGGADNGPPGVREIYHPSYYAAFILDPEGHNIEAVCLEPEDGA